MVTMCIGTGWRGREFEPVNYCAPLGENEKDIVVDLCFWLAERDAMEWRG